MKLVSITPSKSSGKKWDALFDTGKRVPFGMDGYLDYTQHGDPVRRQRYLMRHKSREDWNDPTTAGALSRWILWENKDMGRAVAMFRRRFNL
jgi:hypothetical protein